MTDRSLPTPLRDFLEATRSDGDAAGIAWSEGEGDVTSDWRGEGTSDGVEPQFVIYSIAKSMIATILLAMQEVGRLHVDAPLSDFYPGIPNAGKISLRRMLNHTAGFPDYGGLESYKEDLADHPEQPWSPEKVARETWEKGMLFEPGEGWSYSNPAYMLLRQIVEMVSEMTFLELVDYWIASPLELGRTRVARTISDLAGIVPSPSSALSTDRSLRDIRSCYHPGWVSHGLVISTPSEIVRFYSSLFSGKIITDHSLEEMRRSVPVPDRSPQWGSPGYGLGLMTDPESSHGEFLGHGGGGPGTTTFAGYFPEQKLTVCVMSAGERREAEDGVWGRVSGA